MHKNRAKNYLISKKVSRKLTKTGFRFTLIPTQSQEENTKRRGQTSPDFHKSGPKCFHNPTEIKIDFSWNEPRI